MNPGRRSVSVCLCVCVSGCVWIVAQPISQSANRLEPCSRSAGEMDVINWSRRDNAESGTLGWQVIYRYRRWAYGELNKRELMQGRWTKSGVESE
ncbi:hypothetical protein BGZ61DRAFT_199837 [Ilyonectria robusta]|uniref:uncharacterized protein n=1 Tax=Ilyonectria robusta TaxID=1079257 RepID=UPI001E8D6448|nr:uncharacterized protein BGZ61DRAFT_199837 [Ilyonectria robusta]KAH8722101.1 hypothetical protein BGZ61DRAFT_199837 [Ilyonectria robusta]